MSNRIQLRDDNAVSMTDAGTRARRRIGAASKRRLARSIVDRGRRSRTWIRALVLCKAALLAAVLMVE